MVFTDKQANSKRAMLTEFTIFDCWCLKTMSDLYKPYESFCMSSIDCMMTIKTYSSDVTQIGLFTSYFHF